MNVQKSGLTKAVVAIIAVLLVVIAGLGAVFVTQQPQQALTKTVSVTATQTVSVTTTLTPVQTPTANNTIDLRANSTVVLAVVATSGETSFLIGTLINPTIKVIVGTRVKVFFYTDVGEGRFGHSFVIVSSKPPFHGLLYQAELIPAFPGASTDNPGPDPPLFSLATPELIFTADKAGTYYYISGVLLDASFGMYGQFIVEG